MLLQPGLVSISFRELSVEEVATAAARAELEAVEWGGDVHVPHGDVRSAKTAKRMSTECGLATPSYGSYYRLGGKNNPDFREVIDCALELSAQTIRIWAGDALPSAEATDSIRGRLAEECRTICGEAEVHGIRIATEYHANTLTDTNDSAQRFFREVGHANLYSYWQPLNGMDPEYCAAGLRRIIERVNLLHVFHWGETGSDDKRPLAEGAERWATYLDIAKGHAQWALLEFVQDAELENLYRDAEVLRRWLAIANATC